MKKLMTSIAALLLAIPLMTQTTSTSDFFLELADNYCSNATTILTSANRPSERLCPSHHTNIRLKHFPTVVHEDYHIFNHELNGGHMAEDAKERLFWINDSITIAVPKFPVFNSRVLATHVALETREKVPSYDTYLLNRYRYEHDAQRNGILGILEEMCAYYQGAQAYVELYEYYQDETEMLDGIDWVHYLVTASDMYAYYEFKLFISWYMQVAKEKYPTVYQEIIQNKSLKVLYSLLDLQYRETISRYFANREEVLNEWAANEINIKVHSNYMWVDKTITNSNTIGYDLPENTIRVLQKVLAEPGHEVLADLHVEGLTLENYRDFLE